METNPTPPADNTISRKNEGTTAATKKASAPRRKAAAASKTEKAQRQRQGSPNPEKLVCRYCASDDLAPSFKKRRDTRCRACFKKRYSSNTKHKTEPNPKRKKAS